MGGQMAAPNGQNSGGKPAGVAGDANVDHGSWDDNMDYDSPPMKAKRQAQADAKADGGEREGEKEEGESKDDVGGRFGLGNGVRADENWLEDDFDS